MAADPIAGVAASDACPTGPNRCPHCAAGRPASPADAGDPRDLSVSAADLDDAQRFALPPTYHRPEFCDTIRPPGWFCAVCWDGYEISSWPCTVAVAHGTYLRRALRTEYAALKKLQPTVFGAAELLGR